MATKLVNVIKAFTLSVIQDGQLVKLKVEAGLQRLEKDIAEHWYTIAHSADVPKGVTKSDADVAAEEAKAAEAQAAKDKEEADAEAKKKAEEDAKASGGDAPKNGGDPTKAVQTQG